MTASILITNIHERLKLEQTQLKVAKLNFTPLHRHFRVCLEVAIFLTQQESKMFSACIPPQAAS